MGVGTIYMCVIYIHDLIYRNYIVDLRLYFDTNFMNNDNNTGEKNK